jgi:hypothetical protein
VRDCIFGAGALVSVLLILGCTRWEPYLVPKAPEPTLPSYLRVSAPARESTVLVEPFVRRDTLYGRSRGDTLGIGLGTIERLERPRLDGLRTTVTVIGAVALWVTLGLLGGALE